MHQAKKGNLYFFNMKTHICVGAESGLVHGLMGTAANVADVTQVHQLLHGEKAYVISDVGYTGVDRRAELQERQIIYRLRPAKSVQKVWQDKFYGTGTPQDRVRESPRKSEG